VLAREAVAWGPTDLAVSPERLVEARRLADSWPMAEAPAVADHPMEPV
jgi:hypothetical protein